MQSAFRVLSLTKPDFSVIIKTLLKCEGFKSYQIIGKNVVDFLELIKLESPKTTQETIKLFSFTYHDAKAVAKLASCIFNDQWEEIRE